MEKIVRKLIELNKIYRELPQDNYSYWEFNNNSRDSRESFARRWRDHAVPAYADRAVPAYADHGSASFADHVSYDYVIAQFGT